MGGMGRVKWRERGAWKDGGEESEKYVPWLGCREKQKSTSLGHAVEETKPCYSTRQEPKSRRRMPRGSMNEMSIPR